jgi:hypothetical protein
MVYRLVLTMLDAVTADGQYSELASFEQAIDACDAVFATEDDWSVQRWQDVARHLAMLVAAALAVSKGTHEAVEYMQDQVELVLDPSRFRMAVS